MARPLEARADTKMRKKGGSVSLGSVFALARRHYPWRMCARLFVQRSRTRRTRLLPSFFSFFFLSSVCMALAASMKKRVRAKKGGLKDPPNRAAAEKARSKKGGLGQCCDTGAKRKHCAHQKERTAAVVGSTAKRDSTTGDSTVPTSTISPAMGTK